MRQGAVKQVKFTHLFCSRAGNKKSKPKIVSFVEFNVRLYVKCV